MRKLTRLRVLTATVLLSILTFGSTAFASWGSSNVDSSNWAGQYLSMAVDPSGNPGMSYYGGSSSYGLIYSSWTGSSWAKSTVDIGTSVGQYTSLTFNAAGRPFISYMDGGNYILKFASYTGTGWSIKTVDTYGMSGFYTSIALDNSGNPWISYYDYSGKILKVANWTGVKWSTKTVDTSGDVGQYTSIVMDNTGNPCISYYDATNYDLKFASWTGVSWSTKTVDSTGDVGQYSSIAMDPSGKPCIAYYNNTSSALKYAKWTGSSWSIQTVNSGSVGKFASLKFDSSGNPGIAYYDASHYSVKYAKWTGSAWSIVSLSQDYTSFGYPSLSFNNTGKAYIAFEGFSNGVTISVCSNAPILSCSQTPGYTTTDNNTVCNFQVNYTDADNDPPMAGYPKLVVTQFGSPNQTISMTYKSGAYNAGAVYTASATVQTYLLGYTSFYFQAYDIWGSSATNLAAGTLTQKSGISGYVYGVTSGTVLSGVTLTLAGDGNAVEISDVHGYYCFASLSDGAYTVTPSSGSLLFAPPNKSFVHISSAATQNFFIDVNPDVSCTGESNYVSEGVYPKRGFLTTLFSFRTKYCSFSNNGPRQGYPKLHVLQAGQEISGSPFTMAPNGDSVEYKSGKLYYSQTRLASGDNIKFYIEAYDLSGAAATGSLTAINDGPFVSDLNVPQEGNMKVVGPAASKGVINPNNGDKAQIFFTGTAVGTFKCRIFNNTGDMVFETSQDGVNAGVFEWVPEDIASGIYVVSVEGPGLKIKKKLAIVR